MSRCTYKTPTQVVFYKPKAGSYDVGIAYKDAVIQAKEGEIENLSDVRIEAEFPWQNLEHGITQGRIREILSLAIK